VKGGREEGGERGGRFRPQHGLPSPVTAGVGCAGCWHPPELPRRGDAMILSRRPTSSLFDTGVMVGYFVVMVTTNRTHP
jgi:hypothetical protein